MTAPVKYPTPPFEDTKLMTGMARTTSLPWRGARLPFGSELAAEETNCSLAADIAAITGCQDRP